MVDKIKVYQNWDPARAAGPTCSVRLHDSVVKKTQLPYVEIKNPTEGISLEGEQLAVRDDITDWIIHPDIDDRILTIGGLAGVGKSVLLSHVQAYLQAIGVHYAVAALMGRSTVVLRKKGVNNPQTMHSLLYTIDEVHKRKTGEVRFTKNYFLDQQIVIIDEGSVIPDTSVDDFMSFLHVRLIVFGDHGQLEPIGGSGSLMKNPRLKLEEPRRQALTSNILKFAHLMRQGKPIPYGTAPGVLIAPKAQFWKKIQDPSIDQIIVGFNRTRHEVNANIRKSRGFYGDLPNIGEKVISLYNHKYIGVYNGQTFIVRDAKIINDDLVHLELDDEGVSYSVSAIRQQFGKDKLDYSLGNKFFKQGHGTVVFIDYAYAISCHKALGSEWKNGCVLEEVHPEWPLPRWGYSGITRFSDDLSYFR